MPRSYWVHRAIILTAVFSSALANVEAQTTWFVDVNAAGADDCSSWNDACQDLQDALGVAAAGDEIWVARGVYVPDEGTGNRKGTFQLLSGVTILGGFAGGETTADQRNPSANATVLSGDLDGNDLPGFVNNGENSYNVVTGSGTDATAVLDGFVITGGNADDNFGTPTSQGAGIRIDHGSPTLNRCSFAENTADFGGAMFNEQSSPKVVDCKFFDNLATFGGAVNNTVPNGTPTAPSFINCLFCGNEANVGGAIVSFDDSTPVVTNCTFTENTAVTDGGAIASLNSLMSVTNSVLWNNSDGGGTDATGQIADVKGPPPTVTNSCIQDGNPNDGSIPFGGAANGNIDDDPLFVGVGCDNRQLGELSPCIDAGDNAEVTVATDLDGNDRIVGGTVDMGAFEHFASAPSIAASTPVDGFIDPRNTTGGIDEITLTFDTMVRNTNGSALSAAAFSVSATGGSPPAVVSIDATANPTIVVTLSDVIEVGQWTTLTSNVESLLGMEASVDLDIAFLPDDIDQSGNVNISDATAFVNEFNGAAAVELIDLNRTGNVNISDATEFVTIFNGGASGSTLPVRP